MRTPPAARRMPCATSGRRMDDVTLWISLGLAAEVVAALLAAAYVVRRYRGLDDRAPFLAVQVRQVVGLAAGGALIGAVLVYTLLRFELPDLQLGPIPAPWGVLLIAVPLAVALAVPIWTAIVWWREG